MKKLNKVEILNRVISGIMEIPLPKDGKTIGVGQFKLEIEIAYKLARRIQFSDNIKEMRKNYEEFKKHIDSCR